METIYDWVALAIFAGLVVLFLQRSTNNNNGDKDASLLLYLAAGAGCAIADYFGNHGQTVVAILLLVATVVFIAVCLKPFNLTPRS
jgi:hypothetical protein